MTQRAQTDPWRRLVLGAFQPPAWLQSDAPHVDVVVSSRARFARNLVGYRFPHHLSADALREVRAKVIEASKGCELPLDQLRRTSEVERDYLIGCRLISPELKHREPGRAVLCDPSRGVTLMVNEEDHIRLQALTAGWSIRNALSQAEYVLDHLAGELRFAWAEPWGYLTSSPYNRGEARRLSSMFHLIGLAHTKRLGGVIRALNAWGLATRGLFGESSRAIGAFCQVSSTEGSLSSFVGAGEYLIEAERKARLETPRSELVAKAEEAVEFAVRSRTMSMAHALRVLAWTRWASVAGAEGFPDTAREVDGWISILEVRGTADPAAAARRRADFLRQCLRR
jgi:protein arginine kinase